MHGTIVVSEDLLPKMSTIESDNQWLVARIARLRRLRQWWLICGLPVFYFSYVGIHEWTNALIPYWVVFALSLVWTLVGYGASALLYLRIVTPVWGRPPFRDLMSLYSPNAVALDKG